MPQRLLAIDPGPEESAWLLYNVDDAIPLEWAKEDNLTVRHVLSTWPANYCAIECVQSFGMPVGKTTFETVEWCGRFIESWSRKTGRDPLRIYRTDVKMHLCHSVKATDATIRQALIDMYGPGRPKAVGTKTDRGPLYGLARDCWSALAVAVTASARMVEQRKVG